MRIVLVNSEYPAQEGHGGIATYTYTIANAFAALHHEVHLFNRAGSRTDFLSPSIRIHTIEYQPPGKRWRWFSKIWKDPLDWEKGQSRNLKQQLIMLHRQAPIALVEIPEYGGLSYAFEKKMPFPVIINFHTPAEMVDKLNQLPATVALKRYYEFEAQAIERAVGYKCPSNALKTLISARYTIPTQNIALIRNPAAPGAARQKKRGASSKEKINLLFAGRLEPRKGIDLLIDQLKPILAIHPDIHFTFAGAFGQGTQKDYQKIAGNRLSEPDRSRVLFHGPLQRPELMDLYWKSTMLIVPSLFENLPYAVLEAMTAQLPIICASSGGMAEIITHKKNGLVFSWDNPSTLLSAIRELILNPALAASCTAQAYQDAITCFSPRVIAEQSLSHYNAVIKHRHYSHNHIKPADSGLAASFSHCGNK